MKLSELAALRIPDPEPKKTPMAARLGAAFQAPLEEEILFERSPLGREEVSDSDDLTRIVALPRRPVPNAATMAAMVEEMTAALARENPACECAELNPAAVREGQDPCIRTLLPIQAWYLWEARQATTGVIGPIGVGHGKTGIDILLPMVIPGCKVAVLLIPPGLRKQLTTDYLRWGQHFKVPNLAGGPGPFWPERPVLDVLPYSMLSRPEQTAYFKARPPDAVIADEVQHIANPKGAGANRLLRFKADHPHVKGYFHSGSLAGDGLEKWWHLAAFTLHEGSPLPLEFQTVKQWAGAIDPLPPSRAHLRAPIGKLRKLCKPGEDARTGFQRRLVETPGVVSTRDASLRTKIIISERTPRNIPQRIKDEILNVKTNAERPDGETLFDITEIQATCHKLVSGFFHRWRFPHVWDEHGQEVEDETKRRAVVDLWYARRKAWNRELLDRLQRRTEHMDSPKLLRDAAVRYWSDYRGPLPVWRSENWPGWIEVKDRVEYVPDTVWLDDYLVRDAAEWARSNVGIVWCLHGSFAREVARVTGLPRYGMDTGGVDNLNPTPEMIRRRDAKIRRGEEWHDRPSDWIEVEDGSRSIVASIKAHGTGKNLQWSFSSNLVANVPANGGIWEQLIGRTARKGQTKDIVTVDVYQHFQELEDALGAARADAQYKQKIEGAQRLLFATYTFDPP